LPPCLPLARDDSVHVSHRSHYRRHHSHYKANEEELHEIVVDVHNHMQDIEVYEAY